MSERTEHLGLLKKDPIEDRLDNFNVGEMLNGNWDKIDDGIKNIDLRKFDGQNYGDIAMSNSNVVISSEYFNKVLVIESISDITLTINQILDIGDSHYPEIVVIKKGDNRMNIVSSENVALISQENNRVVSINNGVISVKYLGENKSSGLSEWLLLGSLS